LKFLGFKVEIIDSKRLRIVLKISLSLSVVSPFYETVLYKDHIVYTISYVI